MPDAGQLSREMRVARMNGEHTGDPGNPIRVVIVDDHQMVSDGLAAVINAEVDMVVVGRADDVSVAKAVVTEAQPDVVLMDFALPSGDGVTCAVELKRERPELRTIILTGSGSEDIVRRAIVEGCDGFLRKTATVDDVVSAVRRAHDGGAVFADGDLLRAAGHRRPEASPTQLSARELEVLRCLAQGQTTASIAKSLFVSPHTVRSHVRGILEKLDAHSKLEAVAIALRDGIVTFPDR